MSRDIRAEGRRTVRAPMHRVWQLVSRPETHPRQVRWWLAADVMERTQATTLVEFRGLFGGLPVTSVQRMTLRPPGRVDFKQVRGTLRNLSGAFVLKDRDGDTDVVIQMIVDAGIPILSDEAVQQILVGGIEATLTGLKATAERDLARPTRRAPAAPVLEPDGAAAAVTADAAPAADESAVLTDAEDESEVALESVPPAPTATGGLSPAPRDSTGRRRRRRRGRRPGAPAGVHGAQAGAAIVPLRPPAARPTAKPQAQQQDPGRTQSREGGPMRRRRRGRRGRGRGPGQPGAPSSGSAAPPA